MSPFSVKRLWPEGVQPSVQQLRTWLFSLPVDEQEIWLQTILTHLDQANHCLQWDHEGRIENLQNLAHRQEAQINSFMASMIASDRKSRQL